MCGSNVISGSSRGYAYSMTADPGTTTPEETVRVRFFASARAAAGSDSEQLAVAPGASVADVVNRLGELYPNSLTRILAASSFLLNGVAVRDHATTLPESAVLDVLPPFAGG